jgi:hypothetical protein
MHRACNRLAAADWLQFYGAATVRYARREDRAGRSAENVPIDFTNKLPVAKGSAGRQSVVRFHSTIRITYLQAAVLLKFVRMYFWRGGLFRNDKDADSLVELAAPFSVSGGISRR